MIDLTANIVHRKLRPDAMKGAEWALVYLPHNKYHPFVVCTLTPDTLRNNEWVHGTYHETYVLAKHDYDERKELTQPRGRDQLLAAGVPECVLKDWFDNQIDMIRDDVESIARNDLGALTLDELVDEALNGSEADDFWDDFCEDSGWDPVLTTDFNMRQRFTWYLSLWEQAAVSGEYTPPVIDEMNKRVQSGRAWLAANPLASANDNTQDDGKCPDDGEGQ